MAEGKNKNFTCALLRNQVTVTTGRPSLHFLISNCKGNLCGFPLS